MKQMNKTKKKVFIILLLACVVIGAFGAYAALSTSGTEKRVIAARTKDITDSNALRFSSNYLSPYANGIGALSIIGTYPISVSSDSDATIGITVCNYPQNNASLLNEADITYMISMKILDSEFKETTVSGVTITSPSSPLKLDGKKRSIQVHQISIPKDSLQTISQGYIQVIVTPDNSSLSAASNNILAANLKIVPAAAGNTAWSGVSGDKVNDFKTLDAYNYQISGTEQCTLTLSWDASLVALSKWSIEKLNANSTTDADGKVTSITFDVGGQDQPTSYMLQFYRVGNTVPASFESLNINLSSSSTNGEN